MGGGDKVLMGGHRHYGGDLTLIDYIMNWKYCYWVAVRRTYVFTLQEVEKICRTLQSHVTLHSTISYFALSWWSRTASCFKEQVAIFSVKVTNCTRFHLIGLMSSSSIILVQHCWLLLYTTDCHCRKKMAILFDFWECFSAKLFKEGQVITICNQLAIFWNPETR